jgi:hypothetical protein
MDSTPANHQVTVIHALPIEIVTLLQLGVHSAAYVTCCFRLKNEVDGDVSPATATSLQRAGLVHAESHAGCER